MLERYVSVQLPLFPLLQGQKLSLDLRAATVATQVAVAGDDPVTRHDDGDGGIRDSSALFPFRPV